MYRVYFDGIEQNEKDIININDVAEFSIIREDGFNSTEQIIREKTEMELQFCGASYSYICEKINTDRCAEVEFRIEDDESGLSYDGTIPVTLVELDLGRRIGKTKIKDTSFSAFIRDYMDVDLKTFNTKTQNCDRLDTVEQPFIFKKTYDNDTDTTQVTAFDVLDLFKYMVNYFTDNTIDVVSTFLTNNKYAITTGYNMHNHGTEQSQLYPELSISALFLELRKKLRLYMAIEYDVANRPYLRIEQEGYFFSNTVPLFSVDSVQLGTIQTYDRTRDFNEIKIGSTDSTVQDGSPVYYPKDPYNSWVENKFLGCGTCTGEKSSALDLVSGFIIDSNVIYEALNWDNTDYSQDEKIFLFNYEVIADENIPIRTLQSGEYYFNETLRNDNVLQNWIDYYGKCISIQRNAKYGFLCIDGTSEIIIASTSGTGFQSVTNKNKWASYAYDNENSLSDISISGDLTTVFTCQENGEYNFEAKQNGLKQRGIDNGVTYFPNGGLSMVNVFYRLKVKVYTDNTFTTLITEFEDSETAAAGYVNQVDLTVTTGNVSLNVGNCVISELYIEFPIPNENTGFNVHFNSNTMSFKMLDDSLGCITQEYNDQNSKPFIVSLDYPLCYNDYLLAKENKQGYVMLADKRFWIKELNYKHNRLSNLKLMGNYPVCGC